MNKNNEVVAREGQRINYKDKEYKLVKEKVRGGCQGCVLNDNRACSDYLLKYCRQGFILKNI